MNTKSYLNLKDAMSPLYARWLANAIPLLFPSHFVCSEYTEGGSELWSGIYKLTPDLRNGSCVMEESSGNGSDDWGHYRRHYLVCSMEDLVGAKWTGTITGKIHLDDRFCLHRESDNGVYLRKEARYQKVFETWTPIALDIYEEDGRYFRDLWAAARELSKYKQEPKLFLSEFANRYKEDPIEAVRLVYG